MTLSPSDLDWLEALAKAVTPGKRRPTGPQEDPAERLGIEVVGRYSIFEVSGGGPRFLATEADFIAACDRETILALVAMARRAPRWIPVGERLPEPPGRVVAWTSSGVPEIATWAQHGWLILGYPGEDAISPGDVTHWMPLPEPPR